ncbi:MAG: hypothetical protein AAB371_00620 [Patescibacteria group bacterium]
MKILPIHKEIAEYLKRRNLIKKFEKQIKLFEENIFHPSLDTELLEPKFLKFWSFRVDKRYRTVFIFRDKNTVEIIDVNNHYK